MKQKTQEKSYPVNYSRKISSNCIFVDIFPEKIIFSSNHDLCSCATCYKTEWVPKINLYNYQKKR